MGPDNPGKRGYRTSPRPRNDLRKFESRLTLSLTHPFAHPSSLALFGSSTDPENRSGSRGGGGWAPFSLPLSIYPTIPSPLVPDLTAAPPRRPLLSLYTVTPPPRNDFRKTHSRSSCAARARDLSRKSDTMLIRTACLGGVSGRRAHDPRERLSDLT